MCLVAASYHGTCTRYILPASPGALAADASLEPLIRVRDEVGRGPQVIVDSNGRTLRVIPGR